MVIVRARFQTCLFTNSTLQCWRFSTIKQKNTHFFFHLSFAWQLARKCVWAVSVFVCVRVWERKRIEYNFWQLPLHQIHTNYSDVFLSLTNNIKISIRIVSRNSFLLLLDTNSRQLQFTFIGCAPVWCNCGAKLTITLLVFRNRSLVLPQRLKHVKHKLLSKVNLVERKCKHVRTRSAALDHGKNK